MKLVTSIVADLLSDTKTPIALKVRILRLFDASVFGDGSLHDTLIGLALDGEMIFIREKAKSILGDFVEGDTQGYWLEKISNLDSIKTSVEAYDLFLALLTKYNGKELSTSIKELLINKAANDPASGYKTIDTISRMKNATVSVYYLCEIALSTKSEDNRKKAIELIGIIQTNANMNWQSDIWERLITESVNFSQRERIILLNALYTTNNISAFPYFEKALQDKDRRLNKVAIEILQKFSMSENQDIATEATKIISRNHIISE